MRPMLLAILFALGACASATQEAATQTPASALPTQTGAPVQTPPPNTTYQPAFAGQTRAPEMRSNVTLSVEVVAEGLDEPWAIEFLPDGRALVTERPGRLRVVARGAPMSEPIAGLPQVDDRNQGGLLDIALSPNFASDRLLYWSFSEPRGNGTNSTSVARGRLSNDLTRVENVSVIFRQEPAWRSTGHYGSRLVWDREGRLYVTIGDRQGSDSRPLAQDTNVHIGKIVRINADGSVPANNPFVSRTDARPEIWSYGHRNIQGAALHPDTGKLWEIEHGPRGGDELNIAERGKNYGWPIISYGIDYNGSPEGAGIQVRDGLEQPIYYWDPVIAPGGMAFYRGDLFPWKGDLVIAALKPASLVRLELDGERVVGEERLLTDQGRVRDVMEASDGALWVVTDEDAGRVLRVTPQR